MAKAQTEDIHFFLKRKIAELTKKTDISFQILTVENLWDIGMDSMSTINLIVLIEQEYGITFEEEEILFENFHYVHQITESILSKISRKPESSI